MISTLYAYCGTPMERRTNFGFLLVSQGARISVVIELMMSLLAASSSASCPVEAPILGSDVTHARSTSLCAVRSAEPTGSSPGVWELGAQAWVNSLRNLTQDC